MASSDWVLVIFAIVAILLLLFLAVQVYSEYALARAAASGSTSAAHVLEAQAAAGVAEEAIGAFSSRRGGAQQTRYQGGVLL